MTDSDRDIYRKLLDADPVSDLVDYEIPAALLDTAKIWAMLASRLMFAVESEGLSALDPALVKEYQAACEGVSP